MKHQTDAYRIIKGRRFVNYCDVLNEEHEDIVQRAKSRKVQHRVVRMDGFDRLFVLESAVDKLEDSVSVVDVGAEITATTFDGPKRFTVSPACTDKHGGHWYCVTHDERFDNQLQKDLHVSVGTHLLAWNCKEHGPEQP